MIYHNNLFCVLESFSSIIGHNSYSETEAKRSAPFCFWGEYSKGLSNQADVELYMINAIATVNWLNALDQSDFS